MNEPVCHMSFYEADAYPRWAGLRLPTKADWEIACRELPVEGNFIDNKRIHSMATAQVSDETVRIHRAFADLWECTSSSYRPYPGYKAAKGAIGE